MSLKDLAITWVRARSSLRPEDDRTAATDDKARSAFVMALHERLSTAKQAPNTQTFKIEGIDVLLHVDHTPRVWPPAESLFDLATRFAEETS